MLLQIIGNGNGYKHNNVGITLSNRSLLVQNKVLNKYKSMGDRHSEVEENF